MAARNDITGDSISSKVSNEQYRSNWDKIFSKKKVKEEEEDNSKTKNDERKDDEL